MKETLKILICLFVFLPFLVAGFSKGFANEAVQWVKEDQMIRQYLADGNCEAASDVADVVQKKNKLASPLPAWWTEIYECFKAKGKTSKSYAGGIDLYFQDAIEESIKKGDCRGAEAIIESAKKKPISSEASLLYRAGNCYESTDPKRSLAYYREIVKKFPEAEVENDEQGNPSIQSRQRINWITGDRAWVFSDPKALINKVIEALRSRDLQKLAKLSSQSEFRMGPHGGGVFVYLMDIASKVPKMKEGPIKISDPVFEDGRYELKTEGWEGDEPFAYFIFTKDEHGWQWTIWAYNYN